MGSIQAMEAFLRRIFTADSLEDDFQPIIPYTGENSKKG